MYYIDDWGYVYSTKEEAKNAFLTNFKKDTDYYWEIIADRLNIKMDIMKWIISNSNILNSFLNTFNEDIKNVELSECNFYLHYELEEVYDD